MSILLASLLVAPPLAAGPQETAEETARITAESVRTAGELIGIDFSDDEIELMLPDLSQRLSVFEALRAPSLANSVAPAQTFNPWLPGMEPATGQRGAPIPSLDELPTVAAPENLEDVAFWSIPELAALLRQTPVTCVDLTRMYLERLKRLDAELHCVITLTEERALGQAAARDLEFGEGVDRGLLHGIPWGVKDLMAVRGTRTTWGAKPFENQMIDADAECVERLDQAGAVLIAKLSVGALAWGDVWFGERTRSPWSLDKGSSGSSAGPASATAAGAVAFALGTETLGSIVSPSVACATSSLRPSFGRVSRDGTMALSWTMDKIGPMTRTVGDAAIVFAAIEGRDVNDAFSRDGRVPVRAADTTGESTATPNETKGMRIGVPKGAFRRSGGTEEIRAELEALGHTLVEVELPSDYPIDGLLLTLSAEGAAAFDELTLSGRDDELVRQIRNAWPNVFRVARLLPAVDYIRAQRLRTLLMLDMDDALSKVDALVHAPYASGILRITNLTGHPTVCAPFVPSSGPRGDGSPRTVCFTGHIDQDEQLMALVAGWQGAHPEHIVHPSLDWESGD